MPASTDVVREAADSCIRLLGKRRRIDTHRATTDDDRLPKYARDYLTAVANLNGYAGDLVRGCDTAAHGGGRL